mgnify:CR=1 FL=1
MKEKVVVTLSIAGFFGIMALSTKINHNNLSTNISAIDSSTFIEVDTCFLRRVLWINRCLLVLIDHVL